jgi:hypothetical protein
VSGESENPPRSAASLAHSPACRQPVRARALARGPVEARTCSPSEARIDGTTWFLPLTWSSTRSHRARMRSTRPNTEYGIRAVRHARPEMNPQQSAADGPAAPAPRDDAMGHGLRLTFFLTTYKLVLPVTVE